MSVSQLVALMWICVMWMTLYDISVVCWNYSCMLYCGVNLIHVLCMGCWGVKLQTR